MSEQPASSKMQPEWGELIVPGLMLAGVGLYLFDVRDLSLEGMIFPLGLIAVIVLTCATIIVRAFVAPPPRMDGAIIQASNWHAARAWLLALVPVPLIWFWDFYGTLLAIIVIVFSAQMLLGAKSWIKSLLLAIAVTAPIYFLFKILFYVRFPTGFSGL